MVHNDYIIFILISRVNMTGKVDAYGPYRGVQQAANTQMSRAATYIAISDNRDGSTTLHDVGHQAPRPLLHDTTAEAYH